MSDYGLQVKLARTLREDIEDREPIFRRPSWHGQGRRVEVEGGSRGRLADVGCAPAIVIDPELAARSADMVVAIIGDVPILGKYVQRGGKIQLLSLNRKWPTCTLEKKRGDRIVGVVTEQARPRRAAAA